MQPILSTFYRDSARCALTNYLADCDDRLLLDLGMVRAADGSMRLASDPTKLAVPAPPRRHLGAFFGAFLEGSTDVFRWFRSLPFRSDSWYSHFFLRE